MFTWVASLNDGQRISDKSLKERLDEKGSKINPWHYILEYLKNNPDKDITHIEIVVNGRKYNSPSKGKHAKFINNVIPEDFWIAYKFISINFSLTSEYISFSYRIGDYRHFTWINLSTNEMYTEIKDGTDGLVKSIDEEYKVIKEKRK